MIHAFINEIDTLQEFELYGGTQKSFKETSIEMAKELFTVLSEIIETSSLEVLFEKTTCAKRILNQLVEQDIQNLEFVNFIASELLILLVDHRSIQDT